MLARKKPSTQVQQAWWEDDERLVPAPAAPKPPARRTWLYWVVVASLVMLPLSLMGWFQANQQIASLSVTTEQDYQSASRPTARLALEQWLTSDPVPLPNARVLAWQSVERLPTVLGTDGVNKTIEINVHHFSVASGDTTVDVAVTVATEHGIHSVVGLPTVAGQMQAKLDVTAATLWGPRVEATANADIQNAVSTWASALLSGDPTKLRGATGDGDLSNTYIPIAGLQFKDVRIEFSTSPSMQGEGEPIRDRMFAHAIITFVHSGVVAPPGGQEPISTMEFDLLIAATDTGAPKVVAWGPTGTAPSLTQYGNANKVPNLEASVAPIPSQEPNVDQTQQPAAQPSSSESGPAAAPTDAPASTPDDPASATESTSQEEQPSGEEE